ncbi:hypothetical protein HYPSUDRAFT_202784 [Hypholoma sublateritium FD-334 SS-4]|uniref:Transcription elongation factor Eaf N-terminal domain-containing protein n=1 Tax=Hypholoma sublateritium (strain FD-334 SS-4) TaxID=945553 RepID=A0A0D2MDR8_HYPSF|nr:hypothetical protein HYPSUDRAFT_202784 [Hypholoma sublateritium FD-334 SS-4]
MASSSSWMPPQGRHTVNIGSSLNRAIKNRKLKGSPAPTTKRSNLPERDFYSFKFNFKASSTDATKAGSIETTKGPENTLVRAEYPSTQKKAGEVHKFNGVEQTARDVDCILIYDEDTGQYTLEKLDSYIQLKFDRKVMVSPQPASPAPIATGKGKAKQEESDMASAVEEDPPRQTDVKRQTDATNLDEIMRQAVAMRREEEEEEGGEVEPPRRTPPRVPSPLPPPKAARAVKPIPRARAELPPKPAQPPPVATAPPPPPPPKVKAAPTKPKKVKNPPPTSYPDEEVIEFGKPAKRSRPSPPRQVAPPPRISSPVSLSFPGGSTPAFAPPPAPPVAKPAVARNIPPAPAPQPEMPPSPPIMQLDSDDDDEEDWEQVPTVTPVIAQPDYEAELEEAIFGDGFSDADGGEDIDVNAFEQEMNEQMDPDSEDDFLAAMISPEPERPATGQPISLNRLASGTGAADSDEDDFSSSDESDED